MEEKNKKHITRTHLKQSIQSVRKEAEAILDHLEKVEELVDIVCDNELPHKQTCLTSNLPYTEKATFIERQVNITRTNGVKFATRFDPAVRKYIEER